MLSLLIFFLSPFFVHDLIYVLIYIYTLCLLLRSNIALVSLLPTAYTFICTGIYFDFLWLYHVINSIHYVTCWVSSVTRPAFLMASTSPFTFCNDMYAFICTCKFLNVRWKKNKLEHELELVIGPAGVGLNPWLSVADQGALSSIRDSFSTSRLFKYYKSCDIYSQRPFLSLFFFFINSDQMIATCKNRLAQNPFVVCLQVVDNKLFNHLNHRSFTIL